MDTPLLSGKRLVSSLSPCSDTSSPEEKKTREEEFDEVHSDNDEVLTALNMAGDLAAKIDLALSKLEKLDLIEKRLDTVIASISNIEESVGRLDKEVAGLKKKTEDTVTRVNELEKSATFNEEELSDVKRDAKKAIFETEELKKQLLYMEAYSRRENLKFAGIPENTENTKAENTKEIVYDFMEKELKIAKPRERIEFQRIHRLGKPSAKGPRLIIARFLRFSDREEVLSQARANPELKERDLFVYDDLPKELYDLRKKQLEKLKQAKKNGFSARFSKTQPDKLYVNGKFIHPDEPIA